MRARAASGSLIKHSSQLPKHSVFFDLNDDETDQRSSLHKADVKLAPQLLQLQFPCADEGVYSYYARS